MTTFRALRTEYTDEGYFTRLIEREVDALPPGDVLIRVQWSSLNYKDALSATGNRGVTRKYPHTPGIDAAGVVEACGSGPWQKGDRVLVTGYDLGMNTDGGYAELVRVPAEWIVACPPGLTLRNAMLLGTAGLTAALCVESLIDTGLQPDQGEVLVTGASGGVGCVAVALLAQLGYRVVAGTGKQEAHDWLKELGAAGFLTREQLLEGTDRPVLKPRWAAVVDTVGGDILFNAIKALRYGASAACCGMAASSELHGNIFPFILRSVNLLGVDSVELPLEIRQQTWDMLGSDWYPDKLPRILAEEVTLEELPERFPRILAGQVCGRILVRVGEH